jgi:ACS family hexuronate transporter-like MFS transporter
LTLYHAFGSWRPAFVLTGMLGFVWLIAFRALYRRPEDHPRLSAEERDYILENRPTATAREGETPQALPYRTLLGLRQTWGYILSKTFTDPVWFFITDWFAIYLVAKGFKLEESLMGFWVPFLAADLELLRRRPVESSDRAGGASNGPRHAVVDAAG